MKTSWPDDRIDRALSQQDPAKDLALTAPSLDAEALFERLVSIDPDLYRGPRTVRPRPRRDHRRRLLGGIALSSAVAGAIAVLVTAIIPGSTIRPPSAAASVLERAAKLAAHRKPLVLGPGQYLYLETTGPSEDQFLDLSTSGPIDVVFHEKIQKWIATNGSGREVDTYAGPGTFSTPVSKENWIAAGSPPSVLVSPAGPDGGSLTTIYGPDCADPSAPCSGTVSDPNPGTAPLDVSRLPTDPSALRQVIEAGRTGDVNLDTAPETPAERPEGTFSAAVDLLYEPEVGVTAALRSALYQVMADVPGIELLGTERDASGRAGTAIAGPTYDGLRDEEIIDPSTGQLLESKTVIVDAARLQPDPAAYVDATDGEVIGWTDILSSSVVGSDTTVPTP